MLNYIRNFPRIDDRLATSGMPQPYDFVALQQVCFWVACANTYNKFDPTSRFGSYKESGFGREGGLQGLAAYMKVT